jgi:hypothetical protein
LTGELSFRQIWEFRQMVISTYTKGFFFIKKKKTIDPKIRNLGVKGLGLNPKKPCF